MISEQTHDAMLDALFAAGRIMADAAERCGLTAKAFGEWAVAPLTHRHAGGPAYLDGMQARLVHSQLQYRAVLRLLRIMTDHCAKPDVACRAAIALLQFTPKTNTFGQWTGAMPAPPRPASPANVTATPRTSEYRRPNLATKSTSQPSATDIALECGGTSGGDTALPCGEAALAGDATCSKQRRSASIQSGVAATALQKSVGASVHGEQVRDGHNRPAELTLADK